MKRNIDKIFLLANLKNASADEIYEHCLINAPEVEDLGAKERIWRRVSSSTLVSRRKWIRVCASVAAGLGAVCLAIGLLIPAKPAGMELSSPNMCEAFSLPGETRHLVLPDSTVVWLKGGSSIVYPSSFEGLSARQVFITGEVFADIAHDSEKPFRMEAAGTVTEVHGTQFGLRAYPDAGFVEVSLVRGSVRLLTSSDNPDSKEYWMEPGDRIRINKASLEVVRSRFNPDYYQSFKDKRIFYFENIPLSEIIERLDAGFDTQITLKGSPDLTSRYFSLFSNNETIDQILYTLDSSLEFTYTLR